MHQIQIDPANSTLTATCRVRSAAGDVSDGVWQGRP